jgi:hypothetical protein
VAGKRPVRPGIGSIQSELDQLYAELGGPAPLSKTIERLCFELPCREFLFASTWPAYREWVPDETTANAYRSFGPIQAVESHKGRRKEGEYTRAMPVMPMPNQSLFRAFTQCDWI